MSPLNYKVSHFVEIDSTNTQLVAAARAGAPDGTVYWADFQTSGRGRLDRVWEAPPRSCLMASVLLREPDVVAERLHAMTGIVALSIVEALGDLSVEGISVKWPNDLVVGSDKLAGVLAELVENPPRAAVVVGFGINLSYAGPANAQATCLERLTEQSIDRAGLLDGILTKLGDNRRLLHGDGFNTYRERLSGVLSTLGQVVTVDIGEHSVTGRASGLSPEGHLILDTRDGPLELSTGDLRRVRSTGQ